jgi:hypothetical protein
MAKWLLLNVEVRMKLWTGGCMANDDSGKAGIKPNRRVDETAIVPDSYCFALLRDGYSLDFGLFRLVPRSFS